MTKKIASEIEKVDNKKYFGVNHYKVKIVKKRENPIQFILGVLSYALFIFLLLVGAALLVYYLDVKIWFLIL